MARLGPGKCVHCLKNVKERNADHVFPKSWYPESTPLNVEKWKVPSCIPCNSEYGKLEQDFLLKVGLCLDPHDSASASVVRMALRALKPTAAHDAREARHRLGKGRSILASTLRGEQIPNHGTFPGLGERWPSLPGERTAVLVPKKSFKRMTEKIVRGIYYIEDGIFIEPPYVIDFYVLPDDGLALWNDALDNWGETYAREPGILVRRAVSRDDNISALFEITFWRQFKTYASVTSADDEKQGRR